MKIKVKKFDPRAKMPTQGTPGSAGWDLYALEDADFTDKTEFGQYHYRTGIGFEIPEGHVGLIFPRSSICKKAMSLSNAVGVIDSDYRGEIKFVFNKTPLKAHVRSDYFGGAALIYGEILDPTKVYIAGDRIGQLIVMPVPEVEFEEVDSLYPTDRGDKGFGSTGK